MRSNSFHLLTDHHPSIAETPAAAPVAARRRHICCADSRAPQDVVGSILALAAHERVQDLEFRRRIRANAVLRWENIPETAESPCMQTSVGFNKAIGPCAIGPNMAANSARKRESYQQARLEGQTLVQVMLDPEAIAVLDRMGIRVAGKPSRPAALKQIVQHYMTNGHNGGDTQTP